MNSSGYDNKNGGLGGGDDAGRLGLKFDNALNGEHLDPATVVHRRPSALAMRRGTNISPYRRAKPAPTSAGRTAPKKYDTPPSLSAQGYGDGTSVNRSPQGSFGTTSQNYGGFQGQSSYGGYQGQQSGFGNTNLGNSGFQGQNPYGGYQGQQPGFGNTNLGNSGFQGQNPYGGYQGQQPGFGNTNLGNSGFQGQNPYGGYQGQQSGFGNTNLGNSGFQGQSPYGGYQGQQPGFGAQTNLMGQTGGFGVQNNSPFSGYGTNTGVDRREGSLSDVLLASRRSSNPNATLGGGAPGAESGDSLESSGHLSPAETYAKLVEESQQERNSWRGFVAWFQGGGKYTVLSFMIVVVALSVFALFLFHRINKSNEEIVDGPDRHVTEVAPEVSSHSGSSESKSKGYESSTSSSKADKKAVAEEYSPRAEALKSAPATQSKSKATATKGQAKGKAKSAPAKKAEPKVAPPKEEVVDDEPTYYGEEGDDSAFHMDDNDFAPSVDVEY
ncbi:MAG: hypothetical protein ACI37J_08920 [Candidatus Bruticola sp.]